MQTCEETLALAKGSCRDTGWLLVSILRHLGLAARFASGYLIQLTPDVKPLEGPDGADARLHRPPRLVRGLPAGRGMDRPRPDVGPAGRRRPHPARLHARAVERRARSRAPSSRPRSTFSYDMTVTRVRETPRITKPYSDEQWRTLLALGEAIERDIGRPATCGSPWAASRPSSRSTTWTAPNGTPTALGPEKRRLAGVLFRRLADASPGAAAAFRPGQVVSRRAAAALGARLLLAQGRRADLARPGVSIALESKPTGATPETAHRFALAFAQRLQLDPDYLFGAFEDTWYYLWRERRLPSNVTIDDGQGARPDGARAPGAGVRAGARQSVGFVLPVSATMAEPTARRRTAGGAGAAGRGSCARRSAT